MSRGSMWGVIAVVVVAGFGVGFLVSNTGGSEETPEAVSLTSVSSPKNQDVKGKPFEPRASVPDLYVPPPPEPTVTTSTGTDYSSGETYTYTEPTYTEPTYTAPTTSTPSTSGGGGGSGIVLGPSAPGQ